MITDRPVSPILKKIKPKHSVAKQTKVMNYVYEPDNGATDLTMFCCKANFCQHIYTHASR